MWNRLHVIWTIRVYPEFIESVVYLWWKVNRSEINKCDQRRHRASLMLNSFSSLMRLNESSAAFRAPGEISTDQSDWVIIHYVQPPPCWVLITDHCSDYWVNEYRAGRRKLVEWFLWMFLIKSFHVDFLLCFSSSWGSIRLLICWSSTSYSTPRCVLSLI